MYVSKYTCGDSRKANVKLEPTTKATNIKNGKPLRSISFYLDIINSNVAVQKLTEDIIGLGANVETFLNKEVDYFVTNRRKQVKSPSCETSVAGTPSSLYSSSRSSVMTAASPWAADPVTAKIICRGPVKSRADTLIERAQKSVKCAEDALQMAKSLGIKIIHLSQFLIWLKKIKAKSKCETIINTKKTISKFKLSVNAAKTRLISPYFKYEDSEGRYCPQYRQFQVWPSINMEPASQSPFCLMNKSFHLNRKKAPSPKTRKAINVTVQESNNSLGNKPGYCDICSVRYANIFEHIANFKHVELVSQPNFYSKLDSYIATLPTLKQLQEKYRCPVIDNSDTRLNEFPVENEPDINDTSRKRLKLETTARALEFGSEEKENGGEDFLDLENQNLSVSNAMVTPERKSRPVKRNALQQIPNANTSNRPSALNNNEHQANFAVGENEENKTPPTTKKCSTRLLRSTSRRRSLSCNTATESSGNNSSSLTPGRSPKRRGSTRLNLRYDSPDSNLKASSVQDNLNPVSKQQVIEEPAPPPIDVELDLYDLDHLMKEDPEDKNWESAIDAFVRSRVESIQCDIRNVNNVEI